MYRGSAEPCPACEGTLAMLQAKAPASGCETCGGVWLGPDATMHVLSGLRDEVETDVAALSVDTARRSLHPPPPDSGARSCPTCGIIMGRLPLADTVVDSCPTHGTFFDRNELTHVVRALHRLRGQPLRQQMRDALDLLESIVNGWLARRHGQ